ncbi:hypothetical protein FHX48_000740 [Microbacterium halimionae]|uniref:HEPN/Toprim N-terminal domain-containing protein n=1 Tax=Microbacterium halimionae TaxID=1526413 RepID=A0A7W3JMV5_9MICO|nr:hypothetical protein [Microbacterium halimionae]NII95734.1 hypothetical protein [Microbacterium halimionae]
MDPSFLFLFTKDDVVYDPLKEDGDPHLAPTLVLTTTAQVLAERLDALGISHDGLESCLAHAVEQRIGALERADIDEDDTRTLGILQSMRLKTWVHAVAVALSAPHGMSRDERTWDLSHFDGLRALWEDYDPRWLLRALLEVCESDELITLDLSYLELGGYLDAQGFDPQAAATVMFGSTFLNLTPAVVITEGVTDAEFLRAAVEIRRPHLTEFIRFYELRIAPGGAGAAVSTAKSFHAAGITNRAIALLDNDTAAEEAMLALKKVQLSGHIVVQRYSNIELCEAYPTLGPAGEKPMNVNGTSASIELYLGTDVLTDPKTGWLRPVQWKGYNATLGAYQGEVIGKDAIQKAFRSKVTAARDNPRVVASQDWSGLDTILDQLLHLLRTVGVPDPQHRQGLAR